MVSSGMKVFFNFLMIFILTVSLEGQAYKLSAPLTASGALPNYDSQAITPDTWEEIDFIYYDDFPYRVSYSNKVIPGCQKTINSQQKFVLRCTERINLIRPKTLVKRFQQFQNQHGWVPIDIREFGINNVHGYITAIKTTVLNTTAININKSKSSPVIATFERHTLTVKTYIFQNIKTRTINIINATPEHRFYVSNKQTFEPIQMINSDDRLINAKGNQIKLLCKNDKISHCGIKYNRAKVPVAVYNLEIYRKHQYFSGKDQVLVHNICTKQAEKWDYDPVLGRWKSYQGSVNIENEQRHGFGISYYNTGFKKYEGEWENDNRHGVGTSYYVFGGKSYEGDWLNDKRWGKGIGYNIFNQNTYTGNWIKGKKHGLGISYSCIAKTRTEGAWLNNEEHKVIKYDKFGIVTKFEGFGGEPFKPPPSNMVDRLFRRKISLSGQW